MSAVFHAPASRPLALRLALAGGGTGGHIVPGRHLLAHMAGDLADLVWFSSGRAVEERAFSGLGSSACGCAWERIALELEPDGGGSPSLARLAARTAPAFAAARRALRRHESEVVLGLGGFTCAPVVLAARSLRIPVALLEVNAARGKATRVLAPLADAIFHAWPSTLPGGGPPGGVERNLGWPFPEERDPWTGPPLAVEYERGAPAPERCLEARAALGFDPSRPLLVVVGGSQGAGAINRFVREELDTLASLGLQVLHQTGPGRASEAASARPSYRAVEYVDDVHRALTACDAVLCRGGASTLAEIAALGKPAWVVPYPHHADRHQERNASQLGAGAVIVPDGDLGPALAADLARATSPLGKERLRAMSSAMAGRVRLGGARRIRARLATLRRSASALESAGSTP